MWHMETGRGVDCQSVSELLEGGVLVVLLSGIGLSLCLSVLSLPSSRPLLFSLSLVRLMIHSANSEHGRSAVCATVCVCVCVCLCVCVCVCVCVRVQCAQTK